MIPRKEKSNLQKLKNWTQNDPDVELRDFKAAIITVFKELKKDMVLISEWIGNFSPQVENVYKDRSMEMI